MSRKRRGGIGVWPDMKLRGKRRRTLNRAFHPFSWLVWDDRYQGWLMAGKP